MAEKSMQPLVDQAAVKALHDALVEGEQSGEPQPFDFNQFKTRKRAELDHSNK